MCPWLGMVLQSLVWEWSLSHRERCPFPRVGFALLGSLTPVSDKQVFSRMP